VVALTIAEPDATGSAASDGGGWVARQTRTLERPASTHTATSSARHPNPLQGTRGTKLLSVQQRKAALAGMSTDSNLADGACGSCVRTPRSPLQTNLRRT
jgi:hypothetical protein